MNKGIHYISHPILYFITFDVISINHFIYSNQFKKFKNNFFEIYLL
jgi:hypothetical protein